MPMREPLRPAIALLLAVFLLPLHAPRVAAEEPPGDYVDVKLYTDRDVYPPGATARVAVELRIDPRVHVNSDSPPDEFAIPTAITWEKPEVDLELSAPSWPKAEWKAFQFTEGKKIPVFEGVIRAYLSVEVPREAEPGTTLRVNGSLRAQGCTQVACYAPQRDALILKLRIAEEGEESLPVNEAKFKDGAAK